MNSRGFTIVELLIVIVVIAILATITVVAYNGIQSRAQDTKRAQDISNIKKALQAYEAVNGGVKRVSAYSGGITYGGWDASTSTNWLAFLRADHGAMPVDSTNSMPVTTNAPDVQNRVYFYHCYIAGQGPLPATDNVRLGYMKQDGSQINNNFSVTACLT